MQPHISKKIIVLLAVQRNLEGSIFSVCVWGGEGLEFSNQ